jgi:hypothetical protein
MGKLLWKIFFYLVIFIFIVVISLNFLTIPFLATKDAVQPFANKYLFAEKITYLINAPNIGDGIIFQPNNTSVPFIGIIITISDVNNIKLYQVMSKLGKPWNITRDKIIAKTYYPVITKAHLQQIMNVKSTKFTCPSNGWVDCMPGPNTKPECSTEAVAWYKANCPNFQGGAL